MYAPEFLARLGDPHPTATMSIAQVVEAAAMLSVGLLMTRFRIKTVLLLALGASALRFGLSALAGVTGEIGWHIASIALHGICYTYYFITVQVFLERDTPPGLKNQAQGLLMMVFSGIGPLAGALVCGRLHSIATGPAGAGWAWFWCVLALVVVGCSVAFALLYRSRGTQNKTTNPLRLRG